jgi:putative pyruvate formate lyase activating enzyme
MKELLKCVLCPRMCSADRLAGELGHCRAGAQVKVFRWGPHHGEEPPLSGVNGSGAVFFRTARWVAFIARTILGAPGARARG